MTELAGEPVTPAMEEMIRRLEAGEDPERIEEELGDALEEEMGDGGGFSGAPRPPETTACTDVAPSSRPPGLRSANRTPPASANETLDDPALRTCSSQSPAASRD